MFARHDLEIMPSLRVLCPDTAWYHPVIPKYRHICVSVKCRAGGGGGGADLEPAA